jgi:hypothetical protein
VPRIRAVADGAGLVILQQARSSQTGRLSSSPRRGRSKSTAAEWRVSNVALTTKVKAADFDQANTRIDHVATLKSPRHRHRGDIISPPRTALLKRSTTLWRMQCSKDYPMDDPKTQTAPARPDPATAPARPATARVLTKDPRPSEYRFRDWAAI